MLWIFLSTQSRRQWLQQSGYPKGFIANCQRAVPPSPCFHHRDKPLDKLVIIINCRPTTGLLTSCTDGLTSHVPGRDEVVITYKGWDAYDGTCFEILLQYHIYI